MTQPEHLTHFWGPIGVTTPIDNITVDPRPGGVFETIMVNDDNGEEYPMQAVFVEVDRAREAGLERARRRGRHDHLHHVTDLGNGQTEAFMHQTNVPEMFRTPEAQAGMQSSFDRFAAYVATL